MVLTDRDLQIIRAAHQAKALCPLDGNKVRDEVGTVLIGCADGDRFFDLFTHHCKKTGTIRHHPLTLNGGPLLISEHSKIPYADIDYHVYMRHLRTGLTVKGMRMIVLCAHAPCAVAYSGNLDVCDVLQLLIEAKLRIKKEFDNSNVIVRAFFHVDYEEQKKTYFVDRVRTETFLFNRGKAPRM